MLQNYPAMRKKHPKHLISKNVRMPKAFIDWMRLNKGSHKTYSALILSRFPEIDIKQYQEPERILDLFQHHKEQQKANEALANWRGVRSPVEDHDATNK